MILKKEYPQILWGNITQSNLWVTGEPIRRKSETEKKKPKKKYLPKI